MRVYIACGSCMDIRYLDSCWPVVKLLFFSASRCRRQTSFRVEDASLGPASVVWKMYPNLGCIGFYYTKSYFSGKKS